MKLLAEWNNQRTTAVVQEATIARSCIEAATHLTAGPREGRSDQLESDWGTFQHRTNCTSKEINVGQAELNEE